MISKKVSLAFHTLMVQGTTSDAGKSTLVAGLCRVLLRNDVSVAPFKPQNMALNSAITVEGGEIGRAQAVQAQAAGIPPSHHMNPVLIKPASDTGAQIIIHGKPAEAMDAQQYHQYKPLAQQAVIYSYQQLIQQYQAIIVEGAGSPAEINLREGDIANMGFAEAVDCPVIIVADIDKGGVFAHLVGTLDLLSTSEQARVVGFVINRFRGDIKLLEPGIDWLEARTQKPVLGVIPYIHNFYLAAEDAVETAQPTGKTDEAVKAQHRVNIVVPVLTRMSNHTDFDALRLHPNVDLQFVDATQPPPSCELVIIPGTKNVIADCTYLMANDWQAYLQKHLRYGGKVMGICGGFQMLGREILDPDQLEGEQTYQHGFDYLPIRTHLKPNKITQNQRILLEVDGKSSLASGYEIHQGISLKAESECGAKYFSVCDDDDGNFEGEIGCINQDQNVLGTYLHGIFDQADTCNTLLRWAGLTLNTAVSLEDIQEQEIDRLADTLEAHMDFNALNVGLRAYQQTRVGEL